jgi:hypothetical protein
MNYLIEIQNAEYYKDYNLFLSFSDGTKKLIDLKEELNGEALKSLCDLDLFKKFQVNKNIEQLNGKMGLI